MAQSAVLQLCFRSRLALWACRPIVWDAILRALVITEVAQQAAAQVADGIVVVDVPKPRGVVAAAREDMPAVGRKGYTEDCPPMAGETPYFGTSANIPESRGHVDAATQSVVPVGRKGDTPDVPSVTGEALRFCAARHFP